MAKNHYDRNGKIREDGVNYNKRGRMFKRTDFEIREGKKANMNNRSKGSKQTFFDYLTYGFLEDQATAMITTKFTALLGKEDILKGWAEEWRQKRKEQMQNYGQGKSKEISER